MPMPMLLLLLLLAVFQNRLTLYTNAGACPVVVPWILFARCVCMYVALCHYQQHTCFGRYALRPASDRVFLLSPNLIRIVHSTMRRPKNYLCVVVGYCCYYCCCCC